MKNCKWCGRSIMEFTTPDGKEWWHMPTPMDDFGFLNNTTHRLCFGRITEAAPGDG